jgi:hypothetical protein
VERLRHLDALAEQRTGEPRGYHLALRLQQEAGLRSVEATERFGRASLVGVEGDQGRVSVIGKGGRIREVTISRELYGQLVAHFERSTAPNLAPYRAYQLTFRRAALAVGGRTTGTHANRRDCAVDFKNTRYREYLAAGMSPKEAREQAVRDAIELLGHSRNRGDVAQAYLGRRGA